LWFASSLGQVAAGVHIQVKHVDKMDEYKENDESAFPHELLMQTYLPCIVDEVHYELGLEEGIILRLQAVEVQLGDKVVFNEIVDTHDIEFSLNHVLIFCLIWV
jgi:hypothetical protein